MEIYWS